ncbi:MAG TPA: mechanosensitive ion channel family protein [Flavobacteriales bacterium]|nr:mechanosensitive ion channel family protein [Flavobacteriales bacterium]|tara:strand:+ start:138822 stop:139883 length:1062 start_codon:yes stop_codon:yes gene_type:complete
MDFLEKTFYHNTIMQWAISFAIILGAVVVAKILYWLSKNVLKKITAKTKTNLDDILIDKLEEPIVLAIVLSGITIAFNRLTFPESLHDWGNKVLHITYTLNITWLIARVVDALIVEYLVPITEKTENDLDDQLMPILRKGLRAIIWSLGVILALNNAGYDVGALLAGLGIGGLALAMAAKDTVSNFFGGIMIFTDKPFKIGDRIKIGGFDGTIVEIGLRSTRLKTLDGRIVTIPNSKFPEGMVENVSSEPWRKITLKLGLIYDTTPEQIEQAMQILKEIAAANPNLEENVIIGFNEFGDFALGITFIYYIKKGSDIMQTQTDVNLAILKQFNANGLEMAFPTQTVYANIQNRN